MNQAKFSLTRKVSPLLSIHHTFAFETKPEPPSLDQQKKEVIPYEAVVQSDTSTVVS